MLAQGSRMSVERPHSEAPEIEIEEEKKFDNKRAHSAITLRPPSQSISPAARPSIPILHAAPRLHRVDQEGADPPPSLTPPLTNGTPLNLSALNPLPPRVLGYAARPHGGMLVMEGSCDSRFDDRAAYFTHLASLIGQELGLDALRELHVVGKKYRIGHYVLRDSTYLSVLASADCDVATIVKKVVKI